MKRDEFLPRHDDIRPFSFAPKPSEPEDEPDIESLEPFTKTAKNRPENVNNPVTNPAQIATDGGSFEPARL